MTDFCTLSLSALDLAATIYPLDPTRVNISVGSYHPTRPGPPSPAACVRSSSAVCDHSYEPIAQASRWIHQFLTILHPPTSQLRRPPTASTSF
jgi:hypothetical protein